MPDLFSPLDLRGITLRNRIAVSPMQQYIAQDGQVNDWQFVHLGSRAVGGAGLIVSEAVAVEPDGVLTRSDLGLWEDAQIEGWRRINQFIHAQGSHSAIQLAHFGAKGSRAHPSLGYRHLTESEGGWPTISSSSSTPFDGMPVPRVLRTEEIPDVQQWFIDAALRAVEAGFAAIQLHAAHGYLFHQFYSAYFNQRTDRYGGSRDNRIRFLLETAEKVRAAIPDAMPLLVRISATDYLDEDPNGWTVEDSIYLTEKLQEVGVDLVTASGGGFAWVDPAIVKEGYQVPFAEAIRRATGMKMGAVGGIETPEYADALVREGRTDLVVMARAFLRDPYWPLHARQELQPERIKEHVPAPYLRGFL